MVLDSVLGLKPRRKQSTTLSIPQASDMAFDQNFMIDILLRMVKSFLDAPHFGGQNLWACWLQMWG